MVEVDGARGAFLLHGCVPPSALGSPWPDGLPLQIHTKEADEYGDVDVAREVVASVGTAELFLYPGDRHLFSDNSVPEYEEEAATLLQARVIGFLEAVATR
jgi:dienelactone hydrolase